MLFSPVFSVLCHLARSVVAAVVVAGLALRAQELLPEINALPIPPARIPIYYPPMPPPPGGEIDLVGPLAEPFWDAPAELASFVGEPFYPMLGSHLAEADIPRQLRARLDDYSTHRRQLVEELRAALRAHLAPPPGHGPATVLLEREAEEIRRELITDEYDWGRFRHWAVGPDQRGETTALRRTREFQVLRAATFYCPGLAPEQRRLLWEHVIALRRAGPDGTEVKPDIRPGAVISFLPATAQWRLPNTMPATLAAEVGAFVAEKNALQQEIAKTVIAVDGGKAVGAQRKLETVARDQAARIAALETDAERLRVSFAALPLPVPPSLPGDVVALAHDYRQNAAAFQQLLATRLLAVRRELLRYRPGSERLIWDSNFKSAGPLPSGRTSSLEPLVALVVETPPQRERPVQARKELEKAAKQFSAETGERQRALETQRQQLFFATLRAISPSTAAEPPVPPELARRVAGLLAAVEVSDRLGQYSDYLAATLRPGLTPQQRRLLFNATLRDLALPLPPGLRRPVFSYDSP